MVLLIDEYRYFSHVRMIFEINNIKFYIMFLFQLFVTLVIGLVTAVVVIFYMCVLPDVLEHHQPLYAYTHLLYGHYLLAMISFHYFKGVTTKSTAPSKVNESYC